MINIVFNLVFNLILCVLIILFILWQLFTIWVIIEDIKQKKEEHERRLNDGDLCRHKRK